MRTFHIPSGLYKGDYPLYEGVEEFQKHHPDTEHKQWFRESKPDNIEVGDWVESLDGYITKCLRISPMTNKKNGTISLFFRFCNGTFATYERKNGTFHWQKWYGQFTTPNQGNSSGYSRQSEGGWETKKKIHFARLIAMGIPPYTAYSQAKLPYVASTNVLQNKVRNLLMDEEVITEVTATVTPYLDKLKQDEAFSDENMVEYIKDFMRDVRKGSQTQLNSIIPLLSLLGKLPDYMKPAKKKNEIQEAEWNQAPPEGD